MKIFTVVAHPNGFFLNADTQSDFWILLSKSLGWGKFTLIRSCTEFSPCGGIFELSEVQQEQPKSPSRLVHSSNVLWRLPEDLEVLKRHSPALVPKDRRAQ